MKGAIQRLLHDGEGRDAIFSIQGVLTGRWDDQRLLPCSAPALWADAGNILTKPLTGGMVKQHQHTFGVASDHAIHKVIQQHARELVFAMQIVFCLAPCSDIAQHQHVSNLVTPSVKHRRYTDIDVAVLHRPLCGCGLHRQQPARALVQPRPSSHHLVHGHADDRMARYVQQMRGGRINIHDLVVQVGHDNAIGHAVDKLGARDG